MSETKMPAAEAVAAEQGSDERFAYELAFHVLPTVAEGEVSAAYDEIKAAITQTGAEIFDEEEPQRFDLAYEIVKHLEGQNRKFNSAYFGWVRFRVTADAVASITDSMESNSKVLRHLLIRLTRVEEENPFRFHEALEASETKVTEVVESEVVSETPDQETGIVATAEENEEAAKESDSEESEEKNV